MWDAGCLRRDGHEPRAAWPAKICLNIYMRKVDYIMKTRRGFFRLLLSGLLASRFAPAAWASPVPEKGFHMVNGWILTDSDVEVLSRYES